MASKQGVDRENHKHPCKTAVHNELSSAVAGCQVDMDGSQPNLCQPKAKSR